MPYLRILKEHGWSIWPFDRPGPLTAIEIYPRALTGPVTKSSAEARQRYLQRTRWVWTGTQLQTAIASEDAFDAAISALVMAKHSAILEALPVCDDAAKREGEIWVPPGHDSARGLQPTASGAIMRRLG